MQDGKYGRVVFKVGTSTLTYGTGSLNFRRMEQLVRVLSDLKNSGLEIILVTSGAISVGVSRLGLGGRPAETRVKQAAAAVGQCELMAHYVRLFGEYGHVAAQILMTRIITDRDNTKQNLVNTFNTLLSMNVIPVVNENDSVAVEELEHDYITFGDNDKLSAVVAELTGADLLVLLSDIAGLYDSDPRRNPEAKLIPVVPRITEELRRGAQGAGSPLGTGGMATKLEAAQIATAAGADMVIMDGADPGLIYRLFEGKNPGTLFPAKE